MGLASSAFLIAMVLSLLVLDPQRQAMPQQVRCVCLVVGRQVQQWPRPQHTITRQRYYLLSKGCLDARWHEPSRSYAANSGSTLH